MAATKINRTKHMRITNVNAVQGSSYENFSTQKFLIQVSLLKMFTPQVYNGLRGSDRNTTALSDFTNL